MTTAREIMHAGATCVLNVSLVEAGVGAARQGW